MTEPSPLRQEPDRLRRSFLLIIAFAAIVVTALAIGMSTWLGRAWSSPIQPGAATRAPAQIFGIEQTLIERTERGISLQRSQRASLESYGWVDRNAGIAHIPIERAIDLTLEQSP